MVKKKPAGDSMSTTLRSCFRYLLPNFDHCQTSQLRNWITGLFRLKQGLWSQFCPAVLIEMDRQNEQFWSERVQTVDSRTLLSFYTTHFRLSFVQYAQKPLLKLKSPYLITRPRDDKPAAGRTNNFSPGRETATKVLNACWSPLSCLTWCGSVCLKRRLFRPRGRMIITTHCTETSLFCLRWASLTEKVHRARIVAHGCA